MADNKKYYWLKLNEDFFDDDTVSWLEEQENGKDYVIFYLKLCLKSLKDDGRLVRYVGEKLIPYDVKALGKLTNTPVDTVVVAMKTFIEIGLIDMLETGEIYLTQINELIGSETDSAKRMRKTRILKKAEEKNLLPSHCAHNVQECDTEIEKEIEKDKEVEKEKLSGKPDYLPYKEIVDYLNQKAKTKYKSSSKKTQSLIKARFNEGFSLDDFRTVVDKKVNEWESDKKMSQYLRPETLFGTKFEGYLNQKTVDNRLEAEKNDTQEYDLGW